MKLRRKLAVPLVLAILAISVFTSTASAFECFVVSRSDVGNTNATHSDRWVNVGSMAEVFGFVAGILGAEPLTEGQTDWAVEQATNLGLPNDLVFFANEHLPGGVLPPGGGGRDTDGRGIDHAFDWLPTLVGIFIEAAQQPL